MKKSDFHLRNVVIIISSYQKKLSRNAENGQGNFCLGLSGKKSGNLFFRFFGGESWHVEALFILYRVHIHIAQI